MIQKKNFSDAIKANIGVVEGLLNKYTFLTDFKVLDDMRINNTSVLRYYTFSGSVKNCPTEIKGQAGCICVKPVGEAGTMQEVISFSGVFLSRRAIGLNWSDWTKVNSR